MPEHPIVQALVDQLALNADAQKKLSAEKVFLEKSLRDARALFAPSAPASPSSALTPVKRPLSVGSNPRAGGPLETLRGIVTRQPGVTPSEARRLAKIAVVSDAKDPARSIEESLRRMIAEGKFILRDGGLYLPDA